MCQFCDKRAYTTKEYYNAKRMMGLQIPPKAHHTVTSLQYSKTTFLLDTGVSHHVITDMNKLTIREPYEGHDTIVIGSDSDVQITHSRKISL